MTFSELIAVYLFLGGTSAGSYVVLALLDVWMLVRRRFGWGCDYHAPKRLCETTYQRIRRIVYGASLAIIIIGILCLIADLGRPDAFYYLLLYPTHSLVSIGALALSLLSVSLLASFCDAAFALSLRVRRALWVLKIAGIPVAVVVMAYTGLLLKSVVAVKLWQTYWLPVLFVLSALSCGCAVVLLGMCSCEDRRATKPWEEGLLRADLAFVALEIVATALLCASLFANSGFDALQNLWTGNHALLFWVGFVGCALLLPLAAETAFVARRRRPAAASAASISGLVLVGGLCLRLVMVAAGVQPVA